MPNLKFEISFINFNFSRITFSRAQCGSNMEILEVGFLLFFLFQLKKLTNFCQRLRANQRANWAKESRFGLLRPFTTDLPLFFLRKMEFQSESLSILPHFPQLLIEKLKKKKKKNCRSVVNGLSSPNLLSFSHLALWFALNRL